MKFLVFTLFIIFHVLFVAGDDTDLGDYLKHKDETAPSQAQIIYVERLGDCFNRYVVVEDNKVQLEEDELDVFMEDYEAAQTLSEMFNSFNNDTSTIDQALQVGKVVKNFMASMLKNYSSSIDSLSYDFDKKVIVQVMWWLKHEGQGALDKKLAALEELKSSGSVTVESAKSDADMDKACIKGWGMYSAYYHKFDVDQPDSKKVCVKTNPHYTFLTLPGGA
ncbi:hypothetical protein Ddc_21608 [Ditylenchus destructor]|nr:hypothetical protein Ddc_21608 [Ditylenchus destructor]